VLALGLVVLIVVGTLAYALVARPFVAEQPERTPWDLADLARRQITILSGQAAVAITSLVLLITLAHNSPDVQSGPFGTLVIMVVVAFISFVGDAIQFMILPDERPENLTVVRNLFQAAALQEYRTLMLLWLALKPLVDAFGLHEPASTLVWLLGGTALVGWLGVGSSAYRLAIVRKRTAFAVPTIGVMLGLVGATVLRAAVLGATGANYAVLPLVIGCWFLNAIAFGWAALAPVVAEGEGGRRWIDRYGPVYSLVDITASVALLAVLWVMLL
jgi:hypothetical protein